MKKLLIRKGFKASIYILEQAEVEKRLKKERDIVVSREK